MSAISPLFLWLLPLALLPVIIHLLNRLRYRTVKWAAMMFLRSADRDASRRAKIRQWIILAARCLMLLLFLLALARLQSKGRLAQFFDRGSTMVVVLFDRSTSMELERGGSSGRERAVALLQQGLDELPAGSRVLWIDSVDQSVTPLSKGVELERLPMASSAEGPADITTMLKTALQEVARSGAPRAEIWIPTDRQASAWLPEGAGLPDWSEWGELGSSITLRVLDVAQVPPDAGNRSLQLAGPPRRDGEELLIPLRMIRDKEEGESVALTVESGGLSLQDDLLVEGRSFLWEQAIPLTDDGRELQALIRVPADSNDVDNTVAIAWRPSSAVKAKVESDSLLLGRSLRAGLLPRPGFREVLDNWAELDEGVAFWARDAADTLSEAEQAWVEAGGVLLQLPQSSELQPVDSDSGFLGVSDWNEQAGPLATEGGEALRLDLVEIQQIVPKTLLEGTEVMATLQDGSPLLTRREMGEGVVYELLSLPERNVSNLDAGFIWVPMLQRMLQEGRRAERRWGLQTLGDYDLPENAEWRSVDGDSSLHPERRTGRYTVNGNVVALNRDPAEDSRQQLSIEELEEWGGDLDLRVFEDRSEKADAEPSRVEFTGLIALFGLIFLALESWLLTLNVRRPTRPQTSWKEAHS